MPTTVHKQASTQAWRDLNWLLHSPSLVKDLAKYPAAELNAEQFAGLQEWLHTPSATALLNHTFPQPFRRLGLYAEALLRTALEHTPELSLRLQHFPIQEELTKGKRTIGELDYVWQDGATDQLHHWELAVKLYLYIPPESHIRVNQHAITASALELLSPRVSSLDSEDVRGGTEQQAMARELTQAQQQLATLDRLIGTQKKDTLMRKVLHIQQHQLPLAQHPSITQELGQQIEESAYFFKGWLFYPLQELGGGSGDANSQYWSDYHPSAQALLKQPPTWLNPDHLRGWYTTADNFQRRLAQSPPHWRWKILPRLAWLSPHQCSQAETLSADELWQALQEHWIYFQRHDTSPQPQLVVALEQRHTPARQEYEELVEDWYEVHRGFVVPDKWCGS